MYVRIKTSAKQKKNIAATFSSFYFDKSNSLMYMSKLSHYEICLICHKKRDKMSVLFIQKSITSMTRTKTQLALLLRCEPKHCHFCVCKILYLLKKHEKRMHGKRINYNIFITT